ncbi:hypothetical protein NPX13_g9849 [Xylaria arbuscula]|uniref:Uncharacterized protein n=1 Tax=Xylaria arbuscula TaxID=114810 RepID=A0A9W8N5W5_9PEZI|nr:hypothetical protein NPX13_g9849 [Xylaria arbuscula]
MGGADGEEERGAHGRERLHLRRAGEGQGPKRAAGRVHRRLRARSVPGGGHQVRLAAAGRGRLRRVPPVPRRRARVRLGGGSESCTGGAGESGEVLAVILV